MPLPTIITGAVVALIFILIVGNEIRKKKQGRSSCSCGCGGCPLSESCHSARKSTDKE